MPHTVELRALEPEDLELVHTIENDQALWHWSNNSVPYSRYTVRQYLASQHADIYQDGELRQVIMADGQAVGLVDLTDFAPHHLRAEVGIVVLRHFHRQGIASQALHLLAHYAASHLRLRSLYAYVAEANPAGQALFRSLGYQPVGQLARWVEGQETATLFQLLL